MSPTLRRGIRTLWIAAGISFTAWMYLGFQTVDLQDGVVQSDAAVAVEEDADGVVFRPRAKSERTGLIFLPGGMVDPAAYTPLLRAIAAAGHPARLLGLPMRCACTDSQVAALFERIRKVLAAEPGTAWLLAGHSRGGMLAARFARENGSALAGLVLIGTTHPRDFSLAGLTVPVTKIYGTRDGVAPYSKMRENQRLLPTATTWVAIEGGNHVQFGYYRHQLGDGAAAISRAEQQRLLEAALRKALSD